MPKSSPLLFTEALEIFVDWLPLSSIPRLQSSSRSQKAAADSHTAWQRRCHILWNEKVCISEHCKALLTRGKPQAALRESLRDSTRDHITGEELCSLEWQFRFKAQAGKLWTQDDQWWQGRAAARRRFTLDGQILQPTQSNDDSACVSWEAVSVDDEPLTWHFATWKPVWEGRPHQPAAVAVPHGSRVRIGEYPSLLVWRHPTNWGFVLEGPWTIMTSFELPPRSCKERGSVAGAKFRNTVDDAGFEVHMFTAGIGVPMEPPRPENLFIRWCVDDTFRIYLHDSNDADAGEVDDDIDIDLDYELDESCESEDGSFLDDLAEMSEMNEEGEEAARCGASDEES